jgi:hypothetical protein
MRSMTVTGEVVGETDPLGEEDEDGKEVVDDGTTSPPESPPHPGTSTPTARVAASSRVLTEATYGVARRPDACRGQR